MYGPKAYYGKWSKSDRERQIPYDFIHMLNLKYKINEQADRKQTDRYREYLDNWQTGEGLEVWVKKGEGIKKYQVVLTL